jgi:fructose-1,6-bisphosphatase/inositol monophosphatase family enzyme
MPLCMPSVAAAYKGEVVVGVIYDCHRDELFTAIKGRGAFLNGQPIHVGPQQDIGDAIVAMGSPRKFTKNRILSNLPDCSTASSSFRASVNCTDADLSHSPLYPGILQLL